MANICSLKNRISVTIEKKKLKKRNRYYLRWYDPSTKKRESMAAGSDIYKARQKQRELEYELNNPEKIKTEEELEKSRMKIDAFWDKFYRAHEQKLHKRTLYNYELGLIHLKRIFKGKKFLDEITRYDAELYVNVRLVPFFTVHIPHVFVESLPVLVIVLGSMAALALLYYIVKNTLDLW